MANTINKTITSRYQPKQTNVTWVDVSGENPIEKHFINGQWVAVGGGGGGGTTDYSELTDKPTINGVELDGNKTSQDLGVYSKPSSGIPKSDLASSVKTSLDKADASIQAPAEAGESGQVLQLDAEGNPQWVTPSAGTVPDAEMYDDSTNAVQNKVIKEYIDDGLADKAKVDGYYSQMTVGSAENLVGQTIDSEAYLIRPTGGESNEVANGVAFVLKMEGNSCVWNQLLASGRLVDMGLPSGTLWATSNIDITQEDGFAASPFQYGCTMFSWGNIEGHNTPASGTTFDYDWGSANREEPWYEGQVYGSTPGAAFVSNIVANDSQDAARKNVGSLFKMPSSVQFKELIDNCIFIDANGDEIPSTTNDKRVTVNGIVGMYLKSNANGNRLFFACSGYGGSTSWTNYGSYGSYWSASFYTSSHARILLFNSSGVSPQGSGYRCRGFAVRPVVAPSTTSEVGHDNHKYCLTSDKKNMIDLTLLGYPNIATTTPSVAQVEAWLAQHVGTKSYYAYNTGEILSAKTLGIKTYGQNLLNPTTKQAKLIPYEWEDNSNVYTIKNIPNGATATYTPDNTGVAVSVNLSGGSLDITSYGSGVLELSAATADTYVCMKWDGTKDNDVVSYEEHAYDFDVRKVYGKLNGEGELVQVFPNGMKSNRNAHDTLTASKAVVNIGSEDLGSLTWTYSDTMRASLSPEYKNNSIALISNNYIQTFGSWGNLTDKHFAISAAPQIRVLDSNYSDAATFKTAMSGVMLNYELATPITYTDLVYREKGVDTSLGDVLMNISVINWSMEEQLMTPYVDGNPTSIPAKVSIIYSMDGVETIDTLQKTCYFADDVHTNLQALLTCINTNCAETLGGTFAISDTATDKVFSFSFTPNVEPTNNNE